MSFEMFKPTMENKNPKDALYRFQDLRQTCYSYNTGEKHMFFNESVKQELLWNPYHVSKFTNPATRAMDRCASTVPHSKQENKVPSPEKEVS